MDRFNLSKESPRSYRWLAMAFMLAISTAATARGEGWLSPATSRKPPVDGSRSSVASEDLPSRSEKTTRKQDPPAPEVSRYRKALTWKAHRYDPELDITLVGTGGGNAYKGDTPIDAELPILAIRKDDSPRPPYAVARKKGSRKQMAFYRGWAGGRICLTSPVSGLELTSQAVADAICEESCGEGYRMASFHDGQYVPGMDGPVHAGEDWPPPGRRRGGGWNWWAHGAISHESRFWVRIRDQQANPWDR